MKKLFLIAVAFVAVLSFTSCSKTCNCVTTFNNEVIKTTEEVGEGERCGDTDYDVTAFGQHSSRKCTPQLF